MLNDDAIRDIMGSAPIPPKVSMLNPLTLTLPAEQVVQLLHLVLASRDEDRSDVAPILTPVDRQRCIDLLEWARGTPGPLSVSVYPSAEDGLEDLEDGLDDGGSGLLHED